MQGKAASRGIDETGMYYMCHDSCSTGVMTHVVHESDTCSTWVQYMYYMYMCRLHSSMLLPIIY